MDVLLFKGKVPGEAESLIEKIDSIIQVADEAILIVRRLSNRLRPPELDDFGLWAAIESQAKEFGERSGIKFRLDLLGEETIQDPEVIIALFRIFQEALTNIVRHASATRVDVSLKIKVNKIVLKVKDNGKGITEDQISSHRSLGLLGMKERAYSYGGQLKIAGRPGRGTTVTVTIPVNTGEKTDGKNTGG
jgi:signal transduction histidine kinase